MIKYFVIFLLPLLCPLDGIDRLYDDDHLAVRGGGGHVGGGGARGVPRGYGARAYGRTPALTRGYARAYAGGYNYGGYAAAPVAGGYYYPEDPYYYGTYPPPEQYPPYPY
jgi:hypothetical protein